DQAVKSLSDTWHPDDIPTVFTACGRESLCAQPEPPTAHAESPLSPSLMAAGFSKLFGPRNIQLPSPVSPTSRPSPSPPAEHIESSSEAPESSGTSNLIPIKAFVHEVLRRSRTSTGVLQTALCYLEAVRAKVPDVLRNEKAYPTADRCAEEDAEPRIVQGLYEDDMLGDALGDSPFDAPAKTAGPTLDTIRVDDTHIATEIDADVPPTSIPAAARTKEQSPLPPLPSLPSPLCCPRRTFLACLILASKFIQDRSYSNRAWAKLAGLPPREIGRCERAVGEALEWRLWVGKLPTTSSSSGSSARVFSRTKSDGDLLAPASSPSCTSLPAAAWAAATTAAVDAHRWISPSQGLASIPTPMPTPRTTRIVRRSATLPSVTSNGFAAPADPFFLPVGRFDENAAYYNARSAPGTGYEPSFAMDVEPQLEVSPSLSTPTLSYSPMSSASSSSDGSEERTIQMSMFIDLPTPSPSYSATASSVGPWVTNTSTFTPIDPANPYRSANTVNLPTYQSYTYLSTSTHGVECYTAEDTVAGRSDPIPTVPGNSAAGTKMVPKIQLPSFAEAFSGSCPGMLGFGSR
ncbi:hypothetical protein BC628DRAFT_1324518, partial [Trametes gibbosa]